MKYNGIERYTNGININGSQITVTKEQANGYEFVALSSFSVPASWSFVILKMERRIGIGFVNRGEHITRSYIERTSELYDLERKGKWNQNLNVLCVHLD